LIRRSTTGPLRCAKIADEKKKIAMTKIDTLLLAAFS
jgi:hypothetical protein